MRVAAVVVAGGSGIRAGGELPKQYQLIGGKPVIWWTLQAFASHPLVTCVQPVIGTGHEDQFHSAADGIDVLPPVIGGASRQDSCRIGVEAVEAHEPDCVLIHDAARPFVSHDLISNVVAALEFTEGVIPALPIVETIKRAPGGTIETTVDRSGLWTAQTPQGFRYASILKAHRDAHHANAQNLTDDASIAERAGIAVSIIAGSLQNMKITTAHDLVAADRKLSASQFQGLDDLRVGHGIDVHAFVPGDHVTLCGVAIPHSARLDGHSDADAALHALTDAILGAIGEGDIGTHFPPSDAKWKGAASSVFVEKAVSLVEKRGGRIANADITILCEAPRIGPHIAAMKKAVASLLKISDERVAIKATTTEKLGYIGRREGLETHASVLVRLPSS
jgi:2-C-methyl-D-erythritol 4-phosphate cytidylyltransferase/2-C-methyl-D-erythritol 2,4-cyclodiphosphate synthase